MAKIILFFFFLILSRGTQAALSPEEFERRLGNVNPLYEIAQHIGDEVDSIHDYKMEILRSRDEVKLAALERGKISYEQRRRDLAIQKKDSRRILMNAQDADLDDPVKLRVILRAILIDLKG